MKIACTEFIHYTKCNYLSDSAGLSTVLWLNSLVFTARGNGVFHAGNSLACAYNWCVNPVNTRSPTSVMFIVLCEVYLKLLF